MRNGKSFLPEKHIERVLAAKHILDENPGKKIPIKDLAHEVGWNRTELASAFKTFFKQTIKDYHLGVKMRAAEQLLLATHNPVKRIATQMGYKSDSNFSVAFKREMGLAPSDFRNKMAARHNGNKPSKKRTKRK